MSRVGGVYLLPADQSYVNKKTKAQEVILKKHDSGRDMAPGGRGRPPTQQEWHYAMRQLVKAEMRELGLNYVDLSDRLGDVCVGYFAHTAVKNRVNRGRFSAAFLVQILLSLDKTKIDFSQYAPQGAMSGLTAGSVSVDEIMQAPIPVTPLTNKQWGSVVSRTIRYAMCSLEYSYDDLYIALNKMEIDCGDPEKLREKIDKGRLTSALFIQIFKAMAQESIELRIDGVGIT